MNPTYFLALLEKRQALQHDAKAIAEALAQVDVLLERIPLFLAELDAIRVSSMTNEEKIVAISQLDNAWKLPSRT